MKLLFDYGLNNAGAIDVGEDVEYSFERMGDNFWW